ncbi:CDP-glucose 4,6-dehydratase [Paenibacillus aurantiacus]|uniref:CDP-glucose 4,6-dehydratase n=1 Tax=Paenibacillus aurantiacus TaxID=1936118 RepID=A0ABV5L135_9BACL
MPNPSFWKGKKVLLTGHSGFKGTWLTMWLHDLGAHVAGYSLAPASAPNMFHLTEAANSCTNYVGDINDFSRLLAVMTQTQPDIIVHMAAQPLVRTSYLFPTETFQTNILGTVHVFEAARQTKSVRVIINVTSDKCYENTDTGPMFYKESDRIGGHDPYSASKGCSELITESYRQSFFHDHGPYDQRLASARAGNVIGGGDWAEDRLLPDIVRALLHSEPLTIRNPHSVRPWQHVLEPLSGYLLLAEKCWADRAYCRGWNFGPMSQDMLTVEQIVKKTTARWGKDLDIHEDYRARPRESAVLRLDSSDAILRLGWRPKLSIHSAIEWTVDWYKSYEAGMNMRAYTLKQIERFHELEGV